MIIGISWNKLIFPNCTVRIPLKFIKETYRELWEFQIYLLRIPILQAEVGKITIPIIFLLDDYMMKCYMVCKIKYIF